MIYLLSDPHGGEYASGLAAYRRTYRPGDLLILLGDTELAFRATEENRRFTEEFLALPFPVAIIDGNHENYPWLRSFPTEQWCGGTVHRLTEQIVCLQRGEIYEIENKRFFVMGGCKSSAKWKEMGLWYPEEEPSAAEITHARANLAHHGNRVDYVLTHKFERGDDPESPTLAGLCAWIEANVAYAHWFEGHHHKKERIGEKLTRIFDELVALPTEE